MPECEEGSRESASAAVLVDSRAVVTGAGQGTGRAIALELARAGACVALLDIDRQAIESVERDIHGLGVQALSIETDVSSLSSVRDALDHVHREWGGFEIAVNNAAVPPDHDSVAELDADVWNRILSVNLTGVAWCLKYQIRSMRDSGRGGSIINISSIRGSRARAGSAAYVAAKHGVNGLTQVAALESGKYGIRVNAVAPGPIHTDMLETALGYDDDALQSLVTDTSLLGRIAQPQDIADVCVWLASNRSRHVTGAIIPVDAGYQVAH